MKNIAAHLPVKAYLQNLSVFRIHIYLLGLAVNSVLLGAGALGYEDVRKSRSLQDCNINTKYYAARGKISSSNYPQSYDSNKCTGWYIIGNPHDIITISIDDLQIPTDRPGSCTSSYLEIGPLPQITLCGMLPNNQPIAYISERDHVWIKFHAIGEDSGRGFQLQYVRGPPKSKEVCGDKDFQCRNGTCILESWRCNGAKECQDGSDEMNCTGIKPHTTPGPYQCYEYEFGCYGSNGYTCFNNVKMCDGVRDCIHGDDEEHCTEGICGGALEGPWGNFSSPNFPNKYPENSDCEWQLHVTYGETIQLRFQTFEMEEEDNTDYVIVYDGSNSKSDILGTFYGKNVPPSVIESSNNRLFIVFHSNSDLGEKGFNATYQKRGECFGGQKECGYSENDCYDEADHCNDVWDCKQYGGDERGCGQCAKDKFSCSRGPQCYKYDDHCNGIAHCSDGRDEKQCTPTQCGAHNGTFLCQNSFCIYQNWLCDGADDCKDGSDENLSLCSEPSVKVITAAVIGSLICGLLLVIALGCTCKLYALRLQEQQGASAYISPLTQTQEAIMARRSAPPPYMEAMETSRNFDEAQREYMQQLQAAGRASNRQSRSHGSNPTEHPEMETSDDEMLNLSQVGTEGLLSPSDSEDSNCDQENTESNVRLSLESGARASAQWRRMRRKNKSHTTPGSAREISQTPSDQTTETLIDVPTLGVLEVSCENDTVLINVEEEEESEEITQPLLHRSDNPTSAEGIRSQNENDSEGDSIHSSIDGWPR